MRTLVAKYIEEQKEKRRDEADPSTRNYPTIGIDVPFVSFDEAYPVLVDWVERHGLPVSPRGFSCHEARPGYFNLTDCAKGLYTGHDRRLNYRFLAVEALQYLAGHGDTPWHAELLIAVNSRMKQFCNPTTGLFDGAYGPRLKQSLPRVIELLQKDPDTRQAYLPIWSPQTHSELHNTLDLPCTLGFHFFRTGTNDHNWLDMHAMMRSNDLHWGTPYDVAAFCALQCAVARLAGMKPGRYYHATGSLHLYDEHKPQFTEGAQHRLPLLAVPDPGPLDPNELLNTPRLIGGCRVLLAELYDHHCQGADWSDFVSTMEVRGHSEWCPEYWQQWGDLVRFSWKEAQ